VRSEPWRPLGADGVTIQIPRVGLEAHTRGDRALPLVDELIKVAFQLLVLIKTP
jgi:hypothetical protein